MSQELSQLSETPPLPGAVAIPNINKIIQTIATDFAGPDDPAAMAWPYCTWADTGNGLLKRRNAAGTAWVVEGTLFKASLPLYAQDDIPLSDKGPIYVIGTGPMEWDNTDSVYKQSISTTAVKITYDNTASGLTAEDAQAAIDELAAEKLDADKNIVLGTEVTLTNQTAVDFTGIPTTAKRVIVKFSGVSTNGTSNYAIQLGDAGGVENTGYFGLRGYVTSGDTPISLTVSSHFELTYGVVATTTVRGKVVFEKFSDASNKWLSDGRLFDTASPNVFESGGEKELSGALTTVRVTTTNGTDQFDTGTVNISWE